ncbi:MAG: hypothetical protein HQL02_06625 [Nitrospirae bacterium]|nr:hypothetical protein [Nitrospirota bacterium]
MVDDDVELYKLLNKAIGEEGATVIIKAINAKLNSAVLESKIKTEVVLSEGRLNERITNEIAGLDKKLSDAKSELFKWMIGVLLAGAMSFLVGAFLAFLKNP